MGVINPLQFLTNGVIENTPIGQVTPEAGTFTTLTANVTNIQNTGANPGLVLLRNSDSGNNSTRIFLDASGGVASIYNNANSIRFQTGATIGTSSGALQWNVTHTASAVNYVQVTGAATGAKPKISAAGSDSSIGLTFDSKGSGSFAFTTNANANPNFSIFSQDSPINYLQVRGASTGIAAQMSALGSDTNVSMAFQSKGTGAINLAAGSSGVNLSNGGTVTAITKTVAGQSYTSIPNVIISAPTTAGGVQATATVGMTFYGSTPTVNGGGTGYTINDVLTVAGTTPAGVLTLTVTAVSGGVITAATHTAFGNVTTLPSVPYSVTGGTGTGATFTSTWQTNSYVITNAGSGYVEQPTVSFSGGGGSGAAAYASVGSGVALKTLGGTLTVSGSSGDVLRVYDYAGQAGIGVRGHILAGTPPSIFSTPSNGAQTNVALQIATFGTGAIQLSTGGSLSAGGLFNQVDQFRAVHTASAVNFIQATGAITGSANNAGPSLTATGSDTDVNFRYLTKGVGAHAFITGSTPYVQFKVFHTAGTVVNFLGAQGATTGNAPFISANGTDNNIDLYLIPKGTGLVKFGTYTAGAPTATGYISIKAADGTTYKMLVGT